MKMNKKLVQKRRKRKPVIYELPTLNKIEAAVAQDENLPKLSHKLHLRTMHEINFHHLKRNRKSLLIKKKRNCVMGKKLFGKVKKVSEF
ncbi:hypothetical protein NQ317_012270 [Molorchus minor]|uniref:Uncharacterized protein n=1 Tax=Molorchus minor TaxID=1323400 RepID=A0ABQ9K1Y2_9CUCU|nr:hypothetical protein NQ317_012270 [Molorchus minor]